MGTQNYQPEPFKYDSPQAAISALLGFVRPVETEVVSLQQAAGRVLAEAVHADRPSPAVSVSAMDGFAARLGEARISPLPIAGEVRIGLEPPPLPPGACMRITTGGAIPVGAELVIKREDVTESADSITVRAAALSSLQLGESIRRAGENAPAGQLVVGIGATIWPQVVAALASVGKARVQVFRRVRIAVITTGDELVDVDRAPTPWQLRDSNGHTLRSLFANCAWADVFQVRRAPDDPIVMSREVKSALDACDVLVLSGGVSAGHRDYVPSVLAENGVRKLFHGVPQRPGKPVFGGVTDGGRPALGLPGNPVSVMVTARRMVYAAAFRRAGGSHDEQPAQAVISNPDAKSIGLWWHRLVRLAAPGQAELVDGKGSGDIVTTARSDGFVEIPPHRSGPGPWPMYLWRP